MMPVAAVFDVAVELHPLEALPFVQGRKWIRKLRCLSEASFEAFPFFALHKWEPEGQRIAVAFFGIPFLAKQERYVAAGLPPAGNLGAATELCKIRNSAFAGMTLYRFYFLGICAPASQLN